jgi:DNA-directed RNA polymerase specialized sigma24 family protein
LELSSFQRITIQHQFDRFAKLVIAGEAKKHKKELVRRSSNEKLFSELSQQEQDRLCIKDIYPSDYHCFTVAGYDVLVENEAVGEALSDLPKEKREVILLAFFLGMNDGEIAACFDRVRRTVCYQRTSSLKQLKDFLEEYQYGKQSKVKT